MKIAYKVVRVQKDGGLTSIIAEHHGPCFVHYKRGQIVKPMGGKLFVFSKKPTRQQIRLITNDESVRVFRCVVDHLEQAEAIMIGWSGTVTLNWEQFWEGNLSSTQTKRPIADTYFCNEIILLNDVTRSIK